MVSAQTLVVMGKSLHLTEHTANLAPQHLQAFRDLARAVKMVLSLMHYGPLVYHVARMLLEQKGVAYVAMLVLGTNDHLFVKCS